jgi:hypothetical protein
VDTLTEKRACKRRSFTAPIVYTYFNRQYPFDAQTLNHGDGGLSFKSNRFLKPGATLHIRVKEFRSNEPCTGDSKGLRSQTLAEVKWCKEMPDSDLFSYTVGARYYQPDY